jgi:hypothetical protein
VRGLRDHDFGGSPANISLAGRSWTLLPAKPRAVTDYGRPTQRTIKLVEEREGELRCKQLS